MLLRRRNEIFRFSPSTGVLVFYVKTEQFYSTSSSILSSPLHLPFSFSRSSFRDLSFLRCHKFHPRYLPTSTPLGLRVHIFRYPRTQPCSRNPFRSTPAVTLARPSYTYISRIPISRPQCCMGTFDNYIFVRQAEWMRLSISSSFRHLQRRVYFVHLIILVLRGSIHNMN